MNTIKLLKKEQKILGDIEGLNFEINECGCIDPQTHREREDARYKLKRVKARIIVALQQELKRRVI